MIHIINNAISLMIQQMYHEGFHTVEIQMEEQITTATMARSMPSLDQIDIKTKSNSQLLTGIQRTWLPKRV